MSAAQPWSPYGLERHRVALLQRRSRLLAAGILLGTLLLLAVLASTIRQSSDVNPFGGEGGRVGIDLSNQGAKAKPTTLSVAPGRTTVLDQPIQPELRPANNRPPAPVVENPGLNWQGLLVNLVPPLAGAAYAWRLGRKRVLGGLDQVNLGVYKGALPLELHSARHKGSIFTPRRAFGHLFGRKAGDFLPPGPLLLARAPRRPGPAGAPRRTAGR